MNTTWKKSLAMLLTLLFLLSPMGVGTAQETVVTAVETPPAQGEVPAPEDVGGVPSTLTLAPSAPLPGELNANASKSGSFGRVRIVEALAEGAAPVWSLARLSGDALSLSLASGTGAEASLSYTIEKQQGKVSYELTCSAGGMAQTMRIDVDVVNRPTGIAPAASQVTAGVGETITIAQPSALPEGTSFPQGTEFSVSVGGGKSVPLSGLVIDSAGEYAAEVIATCNGVTLRAPIHITVTLQTAVPVTAQGTVQQEPTPEPTVAPTPEPTSAPTQEPANTPEPTAEPTAEPGFVPGAVMADFSLPVQLRLGGEPSGALGNVSYQGVLPKGARIEWALKGQQGLSFAIAASGNGIALSYSGLEDASAGAAEVSVAFTVVAEGGDTLQQGALDVAIVIEEKQAGLEEPETPKDETEGEVTGIYMTPLKNSLEVGESTMIFATVVGDGDLDDPELEWESSDPSVLSVEQIDDGGELRARMTAEGEGTATVSAMAANGVMQTREIVVMGAPAPFALPPSISINGLPASLKVLVGAKPVLSYTSDEPLTNIQWHVEGTKATISPSANAQTATLNIASTVDFDGETIQVWVSGVASDDVRYYSEKYPISILKSVSSVELWLDGSIAPATKTLYLGRGNVLLGAKAKAGTGAASVEVTRDFTWISSNPLVATVAGGAVQPLAAGTTTITASTVAPSNVVSKAITITVYADATGVTITANKQTRDLVAPDTLQLTAAVQPTTTSPNTVTWSSDNAAVTLSSTTALITTITAKAVTVPQHVTITATSNANATITKTYEIDVHPTMSEFYITSGGTKKTTETVGLGGAPLQLDTFYTAGSAVNANDGHKGIVWYTSNPTVMTVSADGRVTPLQAGTAVITAEVYTWNGLRKTATINVTCNSYITGITINGPTEVAALKTITLTATVTPANATNRTVTWASSDANVATVSTTGIVTAKNVAVRTPVTITAKAVDAGQQPGTYQIFVVPAAQSISIWDVASGTSKAEYSIDLATSRTLTLDEQISPPEANQKVTWTTSNANVATVVSNGVGNQAIATGYAQGTATITATAADGSGKKATVTVKVGNAISSITLTGPSGALSSVVGVGRNITLNADIQPSSATIKTLKWESSNTSVATVSTTGVVTGKLAGSTTITATSTDGTNKVSNAYPVTVKPSVSSINIYNTANVLITIASIDPSIAGSKTIQLVPVISPVGADETVTYASSNPAVATVDATTGLVTGNSVGTTTITVSAMDGSNVKKTITVTCSSYVTGITISGPTEVAALKTITLTATVLPANATNRTVTWTSSDTNVATVSTTGVVTARNVTGRTPVTITATAKDAGEKFGTYNIFVVPAVSSITIRDDAWAVKTEYSIDLGGLRTMNLEALVSPDTANEAVTWTTTNANVATVSSTGPTIARVTGYTQGTATITATAADGSGKKATVTVKVGNAVSGITLTGPSGAASSVVGVGRSITLNADIQPPSATIKTLKWESSNTAIATVSTTGVVTGKMAGFVTIKAISTDGTNKESVPYPVQVKPSVSSLNILVGGVATTTASLDPTSVGIAANKHTVTLVPDIYPVGADLTVTFASSNPGVATVDATSGVVTGKSLGTTVITASAMDGSNIKKTITITCKSFLSSVVINGPTKNAAGQIEVAALKSITLSATVLPVTATDKTVVWTSDNTSVATVSTTGIVTAKNISGTATITAASKDDASINDSCIISVIPAAIAVEIYEGGTRITETSLDLQTLGLPKTQLVAKVLPDGVNGTSQKVTWTTTNANVATVDSNGWVTGYQQGTAVITATAADGSLKKASVTVKVGNSVQAIVITGPNMEASSMVGVGRSITLVANIEPTTATIKTLKWESSNTSAATVSATGVVTGRVAGTTWITATATDGSGTTTLTPYRVDVVPSATSLNLYINPGVSPVTTAGVEVGGAVWIDAQVTPVGAQNKCTYVSSNTTVATVDDTGLVTGVSMGTATITVTTTDGTNLRKTLTVTVAKLISGITLSTNPVGINVLGSGKTLQLIATLTPADPSNKVCDWTSSNTNIATVSTNGLVTARAVTTAMSVTITAKAKDGSGAFDTYDITVLPAATGIRIVRGSEAVTDVYLAIGEEAILTPVIDPWTASQEVTWKISNPNIVNSFWVDSRGYNLRALSKGDTLITATAMDGSGKTASVWVHILNSAATSVTVRRDGYKDGDANPDNTTLGYGLTVLLKANVLPAGLENLPVVWSSSNTAVATVDSKGLVTAGKATTGSANIYATVNGSITSAPHTITVAPVTTSLSIYRQNDLTQSITSMNLGIACATQLAVKAMPTNASAAVTWSTSNASIAEVDGNGIVTGIKKGTATITATAIDGTNKKVSIAVTVDTVITSVTIKGNTEMLAGTTQQLTATVLPTTTANKAVTWRSGNDGVATVTSTGLVTAKVGGSVDIYATATDGSSISGIITIQVHASAVTSFAIQASGYPPNSTDVYIAVKDTDPLGRNTLNVNTGGNTRPVEWSSSNETIAKVADAGGGWATITGLKKGKTTITAKLLDGSGKTASVSVTVQDFITRIYFDNLDDVAQNRYHLKAGKSKTLNPKFEPTGVTNKVVTWTSSNPAVATVDRNGLVMVNSKANSGELTEITVTSTDGSGVFGTVYIYVP